MGLVRSIDTILGCQENKEASPAKAGEAYQEVFVPPLPQTTDVQTSPSSAP